MGHENNNLIAKIIYLSEIDLSIKVSNACIKQAKKFNIDLIPFEGIHGYKSPNFLKKFSLRPKYFFKNGRRGVVGCFLSHYLLWRECVELDRPYLILEHDGYFINELPNNILDRFSEVLKLDNECPYSKDYEIKVNEVGSIEISKYHNTKTKNLDLNETGNYMRGAYAYIIKPLAAKKLIFWIDKNGFLPADIQIGDKIVDIKVIKPTIVRLHPFYNNRVEQISLTRNII